MTIELAVEQLQAGCQAHDVEAVTNLFTEDATVSGEGAPSLVEGHDQLRPVLGFMFEHTPKLTITIHQKTQVSAESVLTWLQWSSPSADGSTVNFRSLTVWRKTTDGWKIVSDFYGQGVFED